MKILYITTIGGTMPFFRTFIEELIKDGHFVDIACNGLIMAVPDYFKEWGCNIYDISCTRFPFNIGNIKTIKEIKNIVSKNYYDIVHCHTPIASACTRIACRDLRNAGTKVFYTAHGFHFYKGAPFPNWLLYYPIEKVLSKWTDVLITMNQEDYQRAIAKFKAERIVYVPGVGFNMDKFAQNYSEDEKKQVREKLEIGINDIMLLSVGELNKNKNHEIVIKALAEMSDFNIHYCIAGEGELKGKLASIAEKNKVKLHLLGYRRDIPLLLHTSDIFILPSLREGLNVSLMEAIASKICVICSQIRGNIDLVEDKNFLFDPRCVKSVKRAISYSITNKDTNVINDNYKKIHQFSKENVNHIMKKEYEESQR